MVTQRTTILDVFFQPSRRTSTNCPGQITIAIFDSRKCASRFGAIGHLGSYAWRFQLIMKKYLKIIGFHMPIWIAIFTLFIWTNKIQYSDLSKISEAVNFQFLLLLNYSTQQA